jgi:selenide,water dikinase
MKILNYYLENKSVPGGTIRNFQSYGEKISGLDEHKRNILCDPQTSGGLLVAVKNGFEQAFEQFCLPRGFVLESFGKLVERNKSIVYVQ